MAKTIIAAARNLSRVFGKKRQKDVKTHKATVEGYDEATHVATVSIDGSEGTTEATSTSACKAGDRVSVQIANHKATVTGNFTSPSTDDTTANAVKKEFTEFEDGYQETITGIEGNYSALKQTTDEISGKVADNADNYSSLKQTVDGIDLTAYAKTADVETGIEDAKEAAIKVAADAIKSYVSASGGATTYTQSGDSFTWSVTTPINAKDSTARSNASSAQSTANTASTNANTAKTNASTALSTANSAKTAADNAAKTATNYLYFKSGSGLRMAQSNPSTATTYTQMDSDSFDVVSSGTTVASFGQNTTLGDASSFHMLLRNESLDFYDGSTFYGDINQAGSSSNPGIAIVAGTSASTIGLYEDGTVNVTAAKELTLFGAFNLYDSTFVKTATASGTGTVGSKDASTIEATVTVPSGYTIVGVTRVSLGGSMAKNGVIVSGWGLNGSTVSAYVYNGSSSSRSVTLSVTVAMIHAH